MIRDRDLIARNKLIWYSVWYQIGEVDWYRNLVIRYLQFFFSILRGRFQLKVGVRDNPFAMHWICLLFLYVFDYSHTSHGCIHHLTFTLQELTLEYENKKQAYDTAFAGLESNMSKLEQVRILQVYWCSIACSSHPSWKFVSFLYILDFEVYMDWRNKVILKLQ